MQSSSGASRQAAGALRGRLGEANKKKDWEASVKILEEVLAVNASDVPYQVTMYVTLADKLGDPDRANAFIHELVRRTWDDPSTLNSWAWRMSGGDSRVKPDMDLALRAGLRANELTDEGNASILDTLAAVYFARRDLSAALKWQRRAVAALSERTGAGLLNDNYTCAVLPHVGMLPAIPNSITPKECFFRERERAAKKNLRA